MQIFDLLVFENKLGGLVSLDFSGLNNNSYRTVSKNMYELRFAGYSLKTCKNIFLMDPEKINLDLIECVLSWITSGNYYFPRTGSILIFLPGIAEITSLYDQLCDSSEFSPRKGKYLLVPLHSSLTSEEQAAIFKYVIFYL